LPETVEYFPVDARRNLGGAVASFDGSVVTPLGGSAAGSNSATLYGESGYRELARVGKLAKSDVWPHVVVSAGKIDCRDRLGKLACFSGKEAAR
jgi:hypothetical protein